ncbi:uncharacterized protein BP5553_02143 [Venustampulla echinocandica]|uniref:Uncharacterized protein n=1 Tax=Venustampulla echinocandica TaxID=2656787 RepID=A0A370U313_9HELO|nr:uncharacterized protein BP5553_02143 [Venustampulla echinocandica]RDL42164.1 hypothetical protein BP5553_02143 [Venustampulla echinocandica]
MDSRRAHDDMEEGFVDYRSESHAPPSYASTRLRPPPYKPSYETSLSSHPVLAAPPDSSSNSNTTQDLSLSPDASPRRNEPPPSPLNLPPTAESYITSPPPSYHPLSSHRSITSSPPSPNHPPPSYTARQQAPTSPIPISPLSPLAPTRSYSSSSLYTNLSRKTQGSTSSRPRKHSRDSFWCGSCFWTAPAEPGFDCSSDDEGVRARDREREGWDQGWSSWNNQYAFYIL